MNSIKCKECGMVNFATAETCKRCKAPLLTGHSVEAYEATNYSKSSDFIDYEGETLVSEGRMMTKAQGNVLIVLLLISLAFLGWHILKPSLKYEYKVVNLLTDGSDRTGDASLKISSIQVDEKQIATLGAEGWELVSNFLEMETAYPNFGKSEYVTGLQPNIRPQRVVLIFRRPLQ